MPGVQGPGFGDREAHQLRIGHYLVRQRGEQSCSLST